MKNLYRELLQEAGFKQEEFEAMLSAVLIHARADHEDEFEPIFKKYEEEFKQVYSNSSCGASTIACLFTIFLIAIKSYRVERLEKANNN